MIWDSQPWKSDVGRLAYFLREKKRQKRWPSATHTLVEKHVFLGFYSIRKLIEAHKLTERCESMLLKVRAYPPTGKAITYWNWHRSEEHFDLEAGTEESIPLERLANQFIHSYVFHIVLASKRNGGLHSFLVSSDRQKTKSLLHIPADEVIRACRSVALDDIVESHWQKDPKTGAETFERK